MRLFVAIELPESIKRHLALMQNALRDSIRARWLSAEQMHLTLKFLGETPDRDLPRLIAALKSVEMNRHVEMQIIGTVCFPTHGLPRIVAASLRDLSGELGDLQSRIDQACRVVGFPLEVRRFTPHITLARVKDRQPRPSPVPAASPTFNSSEFVLYESRLDHRGPKYTPLAHFP
jgi:2'-5' RNA ligase